MKKLLMSFSSLCLAACGTQKINCADPTYFYITPSAEVTSVENDSTVSIKKFPKGGTFNVLIADTLLSIDPVTKSKTARISDVYADFMNNDFEIVFMPSGTKYSVSDIHTTQKTKRIANRDRGNSTYGVCYNDFSVLINGVVYTKAAPPQPTS